ncbi:membrane protein [Longispora fulva]|uniref:Putative membrane-anchored protein n=1 Tax=Longispora fulva TaxID=619741 RepID=A0A8J7GEN2_9ACTN|nr:hypothetical protein [Longispora fulva]MBG6136480.1 putative membrane-anchored protein [Longispora fulva]GIG59649.1 membrane protein [Longispora fulva]
MTTNTQRGQATAIGSRLINKVPEVTVYFWIIKVLATTVGETAADFLNTGLHLGLGGTSAAMGVLLAVVLVVQVRVRRYVPALYWAAVVVISVVGTLVTDNLTDSLGVPLEVSSVVFAVALAATFGAWYFSERTLSIRAVYRGRREAFYWLAVLFTFALGTAAGDLVAEGLNLGYWKSALGFGVAIGLVVAARYAVKLNIIVAFWIAYVLTRPLGASLGDYLSQDRDEGGLQLGTVTTSILFLVTILGVVIYLTVTGKDARTGRST